MDANSLAAMADAGLRGVVLLTLAAGVILALRRSPARLRAGVWSAALIGSLVVPLASRVLPHWQLPLLSVPSAWAGSVAADEPTRAPVVHPVGEAVAARRPSPADRLDHLPARGDAAAQSPAPPRALPWPLVVLATWIAGAASILLWQMVGHLRLAVLAARAQAPADPRFLQAMNRMARMVGLQRPVRLAVSHEISTPVTWGVIRPVILLPRTAEGWLLERIELVLLHELAHVRSWHWPLRMLARTACAGHWYNPLAWLALHCLGVEQELACDEEVLRLGSKPSTYASHLLDIARASSPRLVLGGAALDLARKTRLEGRIMAILDSKKKLRHGLAVTIPTILVMAGLVPAIAAVNPWAADGGSASRPQATDSQPEDLASVLREMRDLEAELDPFIADLELAEEDLRPYLDKIEDIEIDMAPLNANIEAGLEPLEEALRAIEVEMEPLQLELAEVESSLEPFLERLQTIHVDMEPVIERITAITDEVTRELLADPELERAMEELHEQLAPMHEDLERLHEEMAPINAEADRIHRQLAPYLERMAAVYGDMEPLHLELEAFHKGLEPQLEELEKVHLEMEEHHHLMEDIHRKMEPYHERMEHLGERLERAVQHEVEGIIETHMGAVCTTEAPFDEAALRITEAASIRVTDDRVRLGLPQAEVREILADLLTPHQRAGSGLDFAPALDRTVDAVIDFEVETD